MPRAVLTSLLALALLAAPSARAESPPPGSPPSREAVAEKSGLAWLRLVDAGNYADSWAESADMFRSALSQVRWVEGLRASRAPLGVAASRTVTNRTYSAQLAGLPSGEYVVLGIATDFAARKKATEILTLRLERDAHWRVAGYLIR